MDELASLDHSNREGKACLRMTSSQSVPTRRTGQGTTERPSRFRITARLIVSSEGFPIDRSAVLTTSFCSAYMTAPGRLCDSIKLICCRKSYR
jgi:hypothetical protein